MAPGGTITRSTFDPRGLVLVTSVGTDDSESTSNMVDVASRVYNVDGSLTQQTAHVDADANNDRVTTFAYDWRNRLVTTTGEENSCAVQTYDNLGRVVTVEQFNGSSAGDLLAHSETLYDDLGQVYRTIRYEIADAAAHTLGNHLTSNTWHDLSARVVKERPAGSRQWTKFGYDSVGRQVERFVGYDSEAGELIFEQSRLDYGCCGDLANATTWQRLPDATGTGVLNGSSGAQPQARVTYQGYWYDEIGRQIAAADYGTNGDAGEPIWPDTVPERSDDVLVVTTEYDDAGAAYRTIDPAGRDDRTIYDHSGRVTSKIEDFGGLARTVSYTYAPDGQIATLTAANPTTGDQVTRYLYGTTAPGSSILRNDLLRAEIYPDSSDDGTGTTESGTYDRIEYTYNRHGQQTSRQDQNGTVREFAYDKLGRLTGDLVTTPGTGIDTQILAISRSYTPLGQLASVSSHNTADSEEGSIANELAMVYTWARLVQKEYQEHAGPVIEGTSLNVQYHYDDSADQDGELTAGLRPTQVVYPNGRVLRYEYSPGDDDALNRISLLADDNAGNVGTVLSRYTRLGLGQIVAEEYPQPRLRYDLTHDNFAGLDRFGRVVDHLWRNDGGYFDVVRIRHAYDRAGNRLWREDAVARSMGLDHDEFYTYDSLNQLRSYAHGGLNPQKTAISAPILRQSWELDPTGNWSRFREDSDGNGAWDVNQSRAHNAANELVSAETWSTPAYDAAGNMTSLPKPSDPSVSVACVYDAWNRLVSVTDNGIVVGQYSYDGNGRRIAKAVDSRSPGDPQGIDTYEQVYLAGDQVIETRRCSSPSPAPQPLAPSFQFVWSLRYIDAPVLRDSNLDADGRCEDERLYYLNDPNFNIVAIADATGEIVERYAYSPYGKTLVFTGNWPVSRTASLYANTTLYTGRELDVETGFGHYRTRPYGADSGRFLGRDPARYEAKDVNLYRYVGDSPLARTDPTGKSWWWPFGPSAPAPAPVPGGSLPGVGGTLVSCLAYCNKFEGAAVAAACVLACNTMAKRAKCFSVRSLIRACRYLVSISTPEGKKHQIEACLSMCYASGGAADCLDIVP